MNGATIPVDGRAMIVDGTAVPFHGTDLRAAARDVAPDSVLCVTDIPAIVRVFFATDIHVSRRAGASS